MSEINDWREVDARLVDEAAHIAEQREWLEHDAVQDPYDHPDTLLARELIFGRISIEQALEEQ